MRVNAIVLFLLIACGTSSDVAVKLDQPFKLKYGASAIASQGVAIEFVDVVGDSRCPTSVQCVWEGNAQIRLRLTVAGQTRSIELNTHNTPQTPNEAAALGYRVRLIDLKPYPAVAGKIDPYRYVAELVLSR